MGRGFIPKFQAFEAQCFLMKPILLTAQIQLYVEKVISIFGELPKIR